MSSKCAPKCSVNSVRSVREKLPTASIQQSFSHRKSQKNRTHKGQKDSGPSPGPSPEGKGSDHRDTPIRRISALCCPLLVSTIVLTFCEFCMPEAFCELEMCAKMLSELCALCERKNSPASLIGLISSRGCVLFLTEEHR